MANGRGGPTRRGGAALPLALLFLVVAAIGGAVAWLELTYEGGVGPAGVSIALNGAPSPATPGEAAPPPETESHAAAPAPPAPAAPAKEPPATEAKPPAHAEATPEPRPAEATPAPSQAEPAPAPPAPPEAPRRDTTGPLPTVSGGLPPPRGTADRQPLSPAPDPALIEKTPTGPLPIVAPDGRRAWQVYARPYKPSRRPRIAVVVLALGQSSAATEAAIQSLPGAVSLAFLPYSERIREWIPLARAGGHEVLLNLPMEPADFPRSDPGPKALLTALTPQQNLKRLEWALTRVTGYVGVVNFQGERFVASRSNLRPVLELLQRRGLLFLDSHSNIRSAAPEIAQAVGLPWAVASRFIDQDSVSRDAIDKALREVESIARLRGKAIAVGQPFPVTLERLAIWTASLGRRGFDLAPVTGVLNEPKGQ